MNTSMRLAREKQARRHKSAAARQRRMRAIRAAQHDERAFANAAALGGRRARRAVERAYQNAVARVRTALTGGTISRDDAELADILGIKQEGTE